MRLKILLLFMGLLFILISAYAQGDIETNKAGAVSNADEIKGMKSSTPEDSCLTCSGRKDKTTKFVTDK